MISEKICQIYIRRDKMKPIKVLVAEGDQDLLHKLTSEIENAPDLNLVGSTSNGKDVLTLI